MTRRDALTTAAGAGAVLTAAEAASRNAYFELRYYRMRNSLTNQVRRTQDFLGKGYLPAARRAGIRPSGLFQRCDRAGLAVYSLGLQLPIASGHAGSEGEAGR